MGEGWNDCTKTMQTIPNRLDTIWCQLCHLPAIRSYVEEKDIQSYLKRANSEGNTYRVAELGGLGRDLTRGFTAPLKITSRFHKKQDSMLPAFLNKAWSAVFNDDGTLRNVVDAQAVSAINQLTKVFSKMSDSLAPNHIDESAEAQGFEKLELQQQTVRVAWEKMDYGFVPLGTKVSIGEILRRASNHVKLVLANTNIRDLEPEHGTGASADGMPPDERWIQRPRYCPILDKVWAYGEYMCASPQHMSELDLGVNYAENAQYLGDRTGPGWALAEGEVVRVSKILAVPKDYRGLRIISAEPRELMWFQKGLQKALYDTIESNPDTRGLVNFTDQSVNQELVRIASIDAYAATIDAAYQGINPELSPFQGAGWKRIPLASMDLSNASDGIAWELVKTLFPEDWVEALAAVRTGRGKFHSQCYGEDHGRMIDYTMHAPMGSAVCFPVMALCLWSILTAITPPHLKGNATILNEDGRAPIWVYGDDIILPAELVPLATQVLEYVGLTVNLHKTFVAGPFRESCGHEYVQGSRVEPVYLRYTPEDNDIGVAGLVTFNNQLWLKYGSSCNIPELIHNWFPTIPTIGPSVYTDPRTHDNHYAHIAIWSEFTQWVHDEFYGDWKYFYPGLKSFEGRMDKFISVYEYESPDKGYAIRSAMKYIRSSLLGRAYPIADADFTLSALIEDVLRAERQTLGLGMPDTSLTAFASSTWVADERKSIRWNLELNRFEFRHSTLVPKSVASSRRDCWGDLLRALIKGGEVKVAQQPIPLDKRVVLKYVWTPIPGW